MTKTEEALKKLEMVRNIWLQLRELNPECFRENNDVPWAGVSSTLIIGVRDAIQEGRCDPGLVDKMFWSLEELEKASKDRDNIWDYLMNLPGFLFTDSKKHIEAHKQHINTMAFLQGFLAEATLVLEKEKAALMAKS